MGAERSDAKVLELIEASPRPGERLREAAKRQREARRLNLGT